MSDLFIPKRIKVGYDKREETYNGKLAYVIYYDNKGVLRKEKSWESWRDKKIAPEEFDNNPQYGFCLNKDVKRFNWSHFGSDRSYIRIYDPRGIEFEITPENLMGILTETDCLKRGLEGKFVYAWKGTELVVLPCGSEEYNQAKQNTERQDQDISARDLKPGHSYTTKKGEEVIYLGRFPWFTWAYHNDKPRKSTKKHVFVDSNNRFFDKSDVKFLSVLNSTDPVLNYAELIDKWNKDSRSSSIEGWEFIPYDISEFETFLEKAEKDTNLRDNFNRNNFNFIDKDKDLITFWTLQVNYYNGISFYVYDNGRIDISTMSYSYASRDYNWRSDIGKQKLIERIKKSVKAKAIMSNGKKIKVESIMDIAGG